LGSPAHAVNRQSSGEEAFLEVIALNNGTFVFEPGLKTDTRSINHPLDSLILKGIQLVDCLGIIENARVTIDSVVHRNQQGLSEAAFEQRINQGAPLEIGLQKKFYIAIDEHKSIKQLAESLNLPRSEWVPVVANLIKVGLAAFTAAGPTTKRSMAVEAKRLDLVVVEQFAHLIKKPDTGAFTYQAFQYFLQQEYLRYKRTDAPVAVIVMDIRLLKPGAPATRSLINPQTVSAVVQSIAPLKREMDLITHYEGQSLAVLLPHTHAHEAADLARRIYMAVNETKITVGMEKLSASVVLGIASIPGDVVFQETWLPPVSCLQLLRWPKKKRTTYLSQCSFFLTSPNLHK
jgi:diguanylate cyclase (GGDEF)-like protein